MVQKKNFWCVILGNEIFTLENGVSDRRTNNLPVENDRRISVDRRSGARGNHNQEESLFGLKNDSQHQEIHHSALVNSMGAISPVRRLTCISDDIKKGEYGAAAGLATLAVINSTADLDDITDSYKQVRHWFGGPEFKRAYDHEIAQHPFSFFRGTLLHKLLDKIRGKNPELADKVTKMDKTFTETKLGKKILKLLKVKDPDFIETGIKNIGSADINPSYVQAKIFEGGFFGKLTARAMERTTVIGLCVLGAFELPKIIKSITKGDNIFEKTENTAKQTAKSAINMTSLAAGIGYFGALGSKMHGNAGSLVGIGVGAMVGNCVSEKIQDLFPRS